MERKEAHPSTSTLWHNCSPQHTGHSVASAVLISVLVYSWATQKQYENVRTRETQGAFTPTCFQTVTYFIFRRHDELKVFIGVWIIEHFSFALTANICGWKRVCFLEDRQPFSDPTALKTEWLVLHHFWSVFLWEYIIRTDWRQVTWTFLLHPASTYWLETPTGRQSETPLWRWSLQNTFVHAFVFNFRQWICLLIWYLFPMLFCQLSIFFSYQGTKLFSLLSMKAEMLSALDERNKEKEAEM